MFKNVFTNATVLVTGHTGFKGSWLSLWLAQLGAHVIGYSLDPPTDPNLFTQAGVAEFLVDSHGDIRDQARLGALLREHQPQFVFHLAAQPLVRLSYQIPVETFSVNVVGTLALLDAVRLAKCRCAIVVATTDKVYENQEWSFSYREVDQLGGHDPYSASKAATELAVSSFRRSFFAPEETGAHGVGLATARAGNVLGGGDWAADRLIPDAIRAFSTGEPLAVRNPMSVRPWQHVLEPLSGYLWLAARLSLPDGGHFADCWNFGPPHDERYSVGEIAALAAKSWPGASWSVLGDSEAPHEAGELRLSFDKARAQLGWSPIWSLPHSIQIAMDCYRKILSGSVNDIRVACLSDIAAFESAAQERGVAWTQR